MGIDKAINDLVKNVNETRFEEKFGKGLADLDVLVKSKTVKINSLLEILPENTIDPTPSLYNSTMYFMAGLLFVAFLLNIFMKPVDEKFHIKVKDDENETMLEKVEA